MIFTYQPEGAAKQTWQIKTGRLLSPEMEAIERVTGTFYPQWNAALLDGSATAARALLWVLRKRENPVLKFDEVSLAWDDFDLEYDLDEKAEIVENYDAAIADGAPEPGPAFVAIVEGYRADLPDPEPSESETVDLDMVEDPEEFKPEPPKDLSPASSSESATNGTSPTSSTSPRLSSIS